MKKYIKKSNFETQQEFFIDPNTGEIMNWGNTTVYVQTEEQKQRAKNFFEKTQTTKEVNEQYKSYGKFIWNVYKLSQKSFLEMKSSTITRLMYLATYICYDGYISDKKNIPLDKREIFTIMNLSEREFCYFYKNLTENNVIYEIDRKIFINEALFKKGELSPKDLATLSQNEKYVTRIYINGVRDLYSKATVRSHKSLSYLFQILPYVNRDYNIVCHNPLETDLSKINKMNLGEFCEIIEYDKKNISRLCKALFEPTFTVDKELKTAMRYVTDKSLNKNSYSMFINPRVYYAGNKWNDVEILGQF